MNFSKVAIALMVFVANVAALGSRPAASEAYLLLTRNEYFRTQLAQKLGKLNRATLKQRIQNAKLRSALSKIMQADNNNQQQQDKSSSRMNRFRRFHH